jgi:hypothetical protein
MDGSLDDWLQQRETVDVETRAIVSSLVTAVSMVLLYPFAMLTRLYSSVERVSSTMADMYSATMRWGV